MYIFDSDIFSLYLHHKNQQSHLLRKIQSTPYELMWITTITIEEVLGGAYKIINNDHRDYNTRLKACELLRKNMEGLSAFQILPLSEEALTLFKAMPASLKRLGTNDCKIVALAKHLGYTVVTRNLQHFHPLCGHLNVSCVDWTIEG